MERVLEKASVTELVENLMCIALSNIINNQEEKKDYHHLAMEGDDIILELDANGDQKAQNVYGLALLSRTADEITGYYLYNRTW